MRCQHCLTTFTKEDYPEHLLAHVAREEGAKQKMYNMKWMAEREKSDKKHKPNERCNCTFVGIRNYCEVLKLEGK